MAEQCRPLWHMWSSATLPFSQNLATKRWIVLLSGTLFLPRSFLHCCCARRTGFVAKYALMIGNWKHDFHHFWRCLLKKKKKKWISSVAADKALNQYIQLIKNWKSRWMYTGLLSNSLSYLEVWEVVKKCVILSHGTARVEGGFSITNSILQENTKLLLRKKNHARLNFKRDMQRQNDWAELKRAITAKKKAVEYLNNIVSKYESNIHALRATQT